MTIQLSIEQKAALFDQLIRQGKVELAQIADFSNTLARVIEERLHFLKEPVFTNPTTGKTAASVFSVLQALDYGFRGHWAQMVNPLKKYGGASVFVRRDLPKSNPLFPTVCIDLEAVESLLPKVQPHKARRILKSFKAEHNLRD